MRLTTVLIMGVSVLLLLFAACQKNAPIYCGEGIEGNYDAAPAATSNIHLEITSGTAPQEKVILIQQLHPTHGTIHSAAVVGQWKESQQTLYIPAQDYGSVDIQIAGQLQWHKGKMIGTLQTTQKEPTNLVIKHQKQP